jgi:hypothetical protein
MKMKMIIESVDVVWNSLKQGLFDSLDETVPSGT